MELVAIQTATIDELRGRQSAQQRPPVFNLFTTLVFLYPFQWLPSLPLFAWQVIFLHLAANKHESKRSALVLKSRLFGSCLFRLAHGHVEQ